ncbi:MAG: hypothetical protein RMJ53_10675 [Chitinophagales bacterium]|nr:hypothetical protein [Chitinophagales bacterium]MDW8274682.1 hypothetical protein [Chitinophagales bacterium]
MKILRLFEKAWIAAYIASFVVTIYNLIHYKSFTYKVYFPLFCGLFCVVIWMNLRGQRRFHEKLQKKDDALRDYSTS